MEYNTAQEAFEDIYHKINRDGYMSDSTKAIYNYGFYIKYPLNNHITTRWRKWSLEYAIYEWEWYKSGNPNADEISKRAKIWKSCQDINGNVNSNYGYQWNRNDQIGYVINELKRDKNTRRAVISIYDGKEHNLYSNDTPCTQGIQFHILNNKLEMTVTMRSNDLVYGFCNDQYCFSNLQKSIADELNIEVGGYYHFATNMHIYERHYDMSNMRQCINCSKLFTINRKDKKYCGHKCRAIWNIQLKRQKTKYGL